MQTSAYLNGRIEINLTDYLLLIHSFWNDIESIPNVLSAFTSSISEPTVKQLNKIDKSIRQLMTPQTNQTAATTSGKNNNTPEFAEYDYFYYLVENFPEGETYFSKWDYAALTTAPCDGVRYYDSKRKKIIIHRLVAGRPFDAKSQNASNLIKTKIQKFHNGAIIDGIPYAFRRRIMSSPDIDSLQNTPVYQRISAIQEIFRKCVENWEAQVLMNWSNCDNIFLSPADLSLINKMIGDVSELIKATEVKLNNVIMLMK